MILDQDSRVGGRDVRESRCAVQGDPGTQRGAKHAGGHAVGRPALRDQGGVEKRLARPFDV